MPAVSERQRRAMQAAAHGKSTLGIPQKVGKEFVGDAEFNEEDHPRDHGKFAKGSGGIKEVDNLEDPDEEGVISNEAFEEYNQRDEAIEENHENLETIHNNIAKLMAELKKHHKLLGKHVKIAERNLERLEEIEAANGGESEYSSPIVRAAREMHDEIDSMLDTYQDKASGMKQARKEWGA